MKVGLELNYRGEEQNHFSKFFYQDKDWFSAKEVAAIVGRSPQHIRDALESKRILGHAYSGRPKKGLEQRKHYQIPKDSVLLYMMQTANYTPSDFLRYMESVC